MWSSKRIKTCSKRKFSNKREMKQEQGLKKRDNDTEEKKEELSKISVCTHRKKRATARSIMRVRHKERWK